MTTDGLKVYINVINEHSAAISITHAAKLYGASGNDNSAKPLLTRTHQGIGVDHHERRTGEEAHLDQRGTRESHDADEHAPGHAADERISNHCQMISLVMFNYNFIRIHQTIRCTPARWLPG